jgi:AcrR family transcriptional regulator
MPTRAEKHTDRRVLRTRRLLREALVNLILQRGWDAVTVLDVCHEADVGRSTFYAHFGDKEDLLVSGFDDLHQTMRAIRGAPGDFAFVEPLIAHARENLKLFRAVVGKRSGQTVQRRFREVVMRLVEGELARSGLAEAKRKALAHYIAGGFVELLTAWLDRALPLEPARLAAIFREFASGTVKAIR